MRRSKQFFLRNSAVAQCLERRTVADSKSGFDSTIGVRLCDNRQQFFNKTSVTNERSSNRSSCFSIDQIIKLGSQENVLLRRDYFEFTIFCLWQMQNLQQRFKHSTSREKYSINLVPAANDKILATILHPHFKFWYSSEHVGKCCSLFTRTCTYAFYSANEEKKLYQNTFWSHVCWQ